MSYPIRYSIDDIKSRFSTVALSNHYQAFFEVNSYILQKASSVGIPGRFVQEDLGLYVSDAVLPGSSFADIEVAGDRQGITERFAQNRIYDDVTFSFYVDRDYNVLKYFECWNNLINPLKTGNPSVPRTGVDNDVMRLTYPSFYKTNIVIHKFNKDNFNQSYNPVFRGVSYRFFNAWPYSVASTPVSYNGSNVLTLNVTFRYDRYIMEDVSIPTIAETPISGDLTPDSTPTSVPSGPNKRRLIPISPSAAGTSGVVFFDANAGSKTSSIVNQRFFDSNGNPIRR